MLRDPITGRILKGGARPPEERFWEKVDKSGGPDACWPWTRYVMPNGYGQFGLSRGEFRLVHRYAYELTVGPIPPRLTIDHLCRNRGCCNSAHMEVVTAGENARRGRGWIASAIKRSANRPTHCKRGHEFTPENTLTNPKNGWRNCRICVNARNLARWHAGKRR